MLSHALGLHVFRRVNLQPEAVAVERERLVDVAHRDPDMIEDRLHRGSAGKELTRDDQALDLAGALANGGELYVAKELLRWIVLDEAVAAENLDAVLRHSDGDLARVQLRHCRLQRRPQPLLLHRGGAVCQQARRLDTAGVLHELGADALKGPDRLAELLPHEGVGAGGFVRTLRKADGERRDSDAARVE